MTEFEPIVTERQCAGTRHEFILVPSIHIEEVRSVEGEEIAGKGNPDLTVHHPEDGPNRYAHRSTHLCPHTTVPDRLISPELPESQETSLTLQDRERDWDFLNRHAELIFDTRRIRSDDSPREKVEALAEDIWQYRRVIQKPGGNDFSQSEPWSHPVDAIMYGSWCLGAAYAFVALCATQGIKARHLALKGHSASEVHLDGRWHYVENIQRFPENGGNNFLDAPFAVVRLDPTNEKYGLCEEQQEFYWDTSFLSFDSPGDGLWLEGFDNTVLTPQNAHALYPEWTTPRFKSPQPDRLDLVWGKRAHMFGGLPEMVVREGQAMQRRFWLGSLEETKQLVATFSGFESSDVSSHNVPDDGGNWWIAVNGTIHPIRDQGGWSSTKDQSTAEGDWYHTFELPLKELWEGEWNTLAIGCDGPGEEYLWFSGHGETVRPAEPCFCGEI